MTGALPTVLLTGFDPFGGEPVNPSWEAVRLLDGWRCGEAVIRSRRLPCVFGESIEVLGAALDDCAPRVVICVGQAGGRSEMSIERVAVNLDDARIADNAGHQPIDTPVAAGGPAARFATLPVKALVRDLRLAGIPVAVSHTAGSFVCNHVFYGLMDWLGRRAVPHAARGGFIHIPFLPEQIARHPGQPSMALETVVAGLRIAVATALAVQQDIRETGGCLS